MTTVKISQLPAITGANTAATDVLPIVDVSGNVTNKITREEFFKNIQGNVGIGTSSPSRTLSVNGTAGFGNGTIETIISFSDRGIFGTQSNHALELRTNGTERMRITSTGNVGIGTTSPTERLQVGTTASNYIAIAKDGVTSSGIKIIRAGTLDGLLEVDDLERLNIGIDQSGTLGTGVIRFLVGSTERVRIDSSGNVGIGTSSPGAKLEVTGEARIYPSSGTANLRFGSGGAEKGKLAVDTSSNMVFETAGSERMRIDSSGNVGVGITNPAYKLVVSAAGASGIELGPAYSGTANLIQHYSRSGGVYVDAVNDAAQHRFNTSGTERARIDASGNLLVGTTAQIGRVTIVGSAASSKPLALDSNASYAEIQSYDNGPLYLNRQGNDVIVNSGGGNLLVGTTTNSGDGISLLPRASASGTTSQIAFNRASTTASGSVLAFLNAGTTVGTVQHTNTATSYNTSSDYRLKENVAPMQNALDTVAQLNPVTYTWKADGSAGQGFIAHELQAVVPDCVTGEKDAVDETGNPQYQGVDTSFLVATLVKAIQELKAEVDSLRAQLNP